MKWFFLPLTCLFLVSCTTTGGKTSQTAQNPIQVETLLKTSQSWDGQDLPPYPKGTPEVTILRITVAPGAALPNHQHPVMNAGVLLEGQILVRTEHGKTRQLKAGDSLSEVVNTWHFGSNNGDIPAKIIVVYAGVKGQPITVLDEGETPTNDGMPQVRLVTVIAKGRSCRSIR